MIILDGLTEFLSIGFTPSSVFQFVRAVQRLSLDTHSTLISTLHTDGPLDADAPSHDLLARLLRISSGWWRIDGLTSGRSADVHGEVSLSRFPSNPQGSPLTSDQRLCPLCGRQQGLASDPTLATATIPPRTEHCQSLPQRHKQRVSVVHLQVTTLRGPEDPVALRHVQHANIDCCTVTLRPHTSSDISHAEIYAEPLPCQNPKNFTK